MTGKLKNRISEIKNKLDEKSLTKVAYDYFKNITPIKSGNARRKTTQNNNEINANYPYASRLDQGYSRQAPKGMVLPTITYLRNYIKKQLG